MQEMGVSACEKNKGMGGERGLGSERVRGNMGGSASMVPLGCRRRYVPPSKWDDAERWITSPVNNGNSGMPSTSHQQKQQRMNVRMPKSKSGPLPPPPAAAAAAAAQAQEKQGCGAVTMMVGRREEGGVKHNIAGGPEDAEGLLFSAGGGWNMELRSGSLHRRTREFSCPNDSHGMINDIEVMRSCLVSQRDASTQMSPKSTSSTTSSPRERSSFSLSSSSAFPCSDPQSELSSKCDTWETSVSTWSRKSTTPKPKNMSKFEREEAKIISWENMQKAKAEAAVRKLEVKLEKKRSTEMKKIMKKLTSAHNKAQEMRNSISEMGFYKHHKHSKRQKATFIIMKYVERVFHISI